MSKINFYYDPQRQGLDTAIWKTISGTPSISSNRLLLSNAAVISYPDIYSGELSMNITIPTAPTAGDVRKFGFAQLNMGAYVGFRVEDDKFYIEAVSPSGTSETELTWDSDWTNAAATYKILWENHTAKFYVNDVFQGLLNDTANLPKMPLSMYVNNTEADNFYVHYIDVRDADVFWPTNQVYVNVGDVEVGAVEIKDAATDTRALVSDANTVRTDTDHVLLAQLIDDLGRVNAMQIPSPTVLTGGTKVVTSAGTAEAIGSSLAIKSIYIRAQSTNTQNIYVGDSSVDNTTSQQVILSAGESIAFDIANRATVYIDSDVNSEGVDYLCIS